MANFFKKKKWFTGFTYKGINSEENENKLHSHKPFSSICALMIYSI